MTIEEAKKQLRELILDREDRERILDTDVFARFAKVLFGKIDMKASIVSGAVKH